MRMLFIWWGRFSLGAVVLEPTARMCFAAAQSRAPRPVSSISKVVPVVSSPSPRSTFSRRDSPILWRTRRRLSSELEL
ncbi:hypothetical protein DFP72DRAFT_896274, partial [Ephemerocybe angulata]